MTLGKAWLVIEESCHDGSKRLLSVISARKNEQYVRDFVEQIYVDRYASFAEKIAYKNNRERSPFKVEPYEFSDSVIRCGHDPIFCAYRCDLLKREGSILRYSYRLFRVCSETTTI